MRRLPLVPATLIAVFLAAPLHAQTGRAVGTVRDVNGKAIKGATIRAVNPDAYPSQITSATDDKGRFAMIGLRSGNWRFQVEAPGFATVDVTAPVRSVANVPPMTFTLARDPGPLPGALDRNIQQQLTAANALRDQGRYDQAIAAYEELRTKNPRFTTLNLAVAEALRMKAARETDPAARRALLDRAIQAYEQLLQSDAGDERAKGEIESIRAEAAAASR